MADTVRQKRFNVAQQILEELWYRKRFEGLAIVRELIIRNMKPLAL
jgi:hypothetical protein